MSLDLSFAFVAAQAIVQCCELLLSNTLVLSLTNCWFPQLRRPFSLLKKALLQVSIIAGTAQPESIGSAVPSQYKAQPGQLPDHQKHSWHIHGCCTKCSTNPVQLVCYLYSDGTQLLEVSAIEETGKTQAALDWC